jgi:hypothetical protein
VRYQCLTVAADREIIAFLIWIRQIRSGIIAAQQ